MLSTATDEEITTDDEWAMPRPEQVQAWYREQAAQCREDWSNRDFEAAEKYFTSKRRQKAYRRAVKSATANRPKRRRYDCYACGRQNPSYACSCYWCGYSVHYDCDLGDGYAYEGLMAPFLPIVGGCRGRACLNCGDVAIGCEVGHINVRDMKGATK